MSQVNPIITIVAALNCEAKPWVDFYRLKKQGDKPFVHYSNSDADVEIVISGIGSTAMSTAIGWVGASQSGRPRVWLNLGTAGHAEHDLATAFRVHAAINGNDLRKYYPPLTARWQGETDALVSVNVPSDSYPENAMVDMEAYAFFQSATIFASGELVQSIKVVSDNLQNSFEQLDASKITELMKPHVASVTAFVQDLAALVAPLEEKNHWQHLLKIKATHSQRQQLKSLLDKIAVLDLDKELESLQLSLDTPIADALTGVRSIVDATAPSLGMRNG